GDGATRPAVTDVWPEVQVQEAGRLIRAVFAEGAEQPAPQELTRALETALDASRQNWPTGLCRRLWDVLAEVAEHRRRAPAHPSLERIDVKQKEQLGAALLKALRRSPVPTYAFFALTRFGARRLFYGPLNAVVHPDIVQQWLDAILPFAPGHQSEKVSWLFCLAQLARQSGQRALDVDLGHRTRVLAVLRHHGAPGRLIRAVEEVVELE